jgi:hypothetical protein
MINGRRADSARRRQRVVKALNAAHKDGSELSISAIARAAAVDRSFLYRHPDLLVQIHTAQASPLPCVPQNSRAVEACFLALTCVDMGERAEKSCV